MRAVELHPPISPPLNLIQPRLVSLLVFLHPDLGQRQEFPQESSRIAQDTEGGGVVPPEFIGIDLHVDQFRGRNIEGVSRYPGTALTIIKLHSQPQENVTGTTGLVGHVCPVPPYCTQAQWVVLWDNSLAIGRRGHRYVE